MSFKLYYIDFFTGKPLLYKEYTRLKDLRKDWVAPETRNYNLKAVEEREITNLPPRPRKVWEEIS
jgi:hypothetical protein